MALPYTVAQGGLRTGATKTATKTAATQPTVAAAHANHLMTIAQAASQKQPVTVGRMPQKATPIQQQAAPRPQASPLPSQRVTLAARAASADTKRRGGLSRILCYGDSLTVGFHKGGDAFEPYGYTMTNALGGLGIEGSTVRVMGLSGKTARECVQGLQSRAIMDIVGQSGKGLSYLLAEEGSFDLAIIMLGTNDIGKGYSVGEIISNIEKLHATCHRMNIPTLAIAPTSLDHGSYRSARNQLAQQLATWAKQTPGVIGCVDLEALVPRQNQMFWEPDKIHLSPHGSQALGRCVAQWLHSKMMSEGVAFKK